jgi:hypothetical protein
MRLGGRRADWLIYQLVVVVSHRYAMKAIAAQARERRSGKLPPAADVVQVEREALSAEAAGAGAAASGGRERVTLQEARARLDAALAEVKAALAERGEKVGEDAEIVACLHAAEALKAVAAAARSGAAMVTAAPGALGPAGRGSLKRLLGGSDHAHAAMKPAPKKPRKAAAAVAATEEGAKSTQPGAYGAPAPRAARTGARRGGWGARCGRRCATATRAARAGSHGTCDQRRR